MLPCLVVSLQRESWYVSCFVTIGRGCSFGLLQGGAVIDEPGGLGLGQLERSP